MRLELLAADPALAEGIPAEELALARRVLVADAYELAPGPWEPDLSRPGGRAGFALLILRGAITRDVALADRHCAELFGPGDVVRPANAGETLVPHAVSWSVADQALVAVLDDRFSAAARRWPSLSAQLTARLLDQTDRLALRTAISQLGRVEVRVLALLWHLADRWGHVTPYGVTVPLRLTHEALGRLVGAQRPTVTLALSDLESTGSVTRSTTRGWLLQRDSRDLLEPGAAPAVIMRA
ncbi:MAG TPA: Crp/Fnr family transcriptional regulator [Solirubrobacteraceae bacterium]|nr:Crp/Fnr family transcriptional regulator [Solirubrobacteraceae bacterium]